MVSFFKRLFGTTESRAKPKEQETTKEHKAQPDVDQISTINIKCVNCGVEFKADTSELIIECPHCGYARMTTWREIGVEASELPDPRQPTDPALRGIPQPIRNPNPIKVKYGTLREPVEKITKIKEATLLNAGKELEEFFTWCSDAEISEYQRGSGVAPHPYERIAIIARKNKDYLLEIAICERLLELSEDSSSPVVKRIKERVKKAHILLQKEQEIKTTGTEKTRKAKKTTIPKKAKRSTILEKQCSELGIPVEEIEMRWDANKKLWHPIESVQCTKVEKAVLFLMGLNGFRGTFYELHPLMQIMQAGCLSYLEESASQRFMENPYARTFNVQVWMYELDTEKTANLIKGASRNELFTNWKKIYQDEQVREWFPDLSQYNLEAVLDGLGDNLFHKIIDYLLEDPERRSSGWPDIFAYDGNSLQLVEVKATDSIRESQTEIWNNFIKPNGMNMKIVHVSKAKL